MFILRLLRPKHIPYHKNDWNCWLHLYYWIIRALLLLYRRSAISDTIVLGNIQIIHNVRDYWYEHELHRFHIDTAIIIEKRSIPFRLKRKFKLSHLFNWSDSLHILQDGRSYRIKRDKYILIDTDKEGVLQSSTEKDFILRSEFVEKEVKPQQEHTRKQTESPNTSNKREFSSKIEIKDTIPTNTLQTPKFVKYQGFEENNLF